MAQSINRPEYSVGEVLLIKYLGQVEFEVTALGFDPDAKCFCYTLTPTTALPGMTTIYDIGEDTLSTTAIRKDVRMQERKTLSDAGLIEEGAVEPSKQRSRAPLTIRFSSSERRGVPLGLEEVPLVRGDSTAGIAGRIEQAVVPPNPHGNVAGRSEEIKHDLELKFCRRVLNDMHNRRHASFAHWFYMPVDPVAFDIPAYFQIIERPMDLSTIQRKLKNNVYEEASEFKNDVQLMFENCYRFNGDGHIISRFGRKLENLFNKKWRGKDAWVAAHQLEVEGRDAPAEYENTSELPVTVSKEGSRMVPKLGLRLSFESSVRTGK